MKSDRSVKLLSAVGLAAVITLVIFCVFQMTKLNSRYSIRQFFPAHHPALVADDEMEKAFQLRSRPAFYATLQLPAGEHGTWLVPARVSRLKNLTEALRSLPDVKAAFSVATIEMAVNFKNELRIGPIFENLPPLKWRPFVQSQALLMPQLISKDLRSVMIVIEPDDVSSTNLTNLENRIQSLMWKKEPNLHRGLAGVPAVQSHLSAKLQKEVGQFLVLCLLVFCLMFFLFYKNSSPVIFAALGLIVSNVTALGFLAAMGLPFTVLLSTLPIIVSIAFVSLAVHTLHLWADRLAEQGSPKSLASRWKLSWKTLVEISLPNLLGSLTTAIGFLTLATAPIPLIRSYALIIAGSVIWTFVLTQILLFFFMPWFTPIQRSWTRRKAWWMVAITRWSVPIFISTIGFCVFMAGAGLRLNFSARLFDDLPATEPVRAAALGIDRNFGGTVNLDVSLDAGHDEAWKDPAALYELHKALAQLRAMPGVGTALGLTDFLGDKTPRTRGAVAEMYFLFSMAGENPLRQFVDNSSRKTRISIHLEDLPSAQIDGIRAKSRQILLKHFPRAQISESGLAVNSHTINREVSKELVFGFWQSLLLIGVLLVFVFRSLRWALLACIPNVIPPAVLIGVMALRQTPVKPAIALIFSIALGLAFNNTVYLLSRLHRLRREKGLFHLPLRRTLLEEGMPCLSESMLTFAGFLIFLSSDFKLNETFGAYMVLSIVAGAWGDLVFLPVLMKLFPDILTGSLKAPVAKVVPMKDKKSAVVEKTQDKKSKIAASLIGFLFLGAALTLSSSSVRAAEKAKPAAVAPKATGASGGDEAKDLLEKARLNVEARSDQATVNLKIIEANGDVKPRQLVLKTLREPEVYHALARIKGPADIKGTALLAEVKKDGTESQWLYLPSSKQVRRVVSGQKSAGVLGSELSPDDLNSTALQGSSVKLLKKDAKEAQIEVKPKTGASEYTRVVMTLSLPEALPTHIDYYSGDQVKKTVDFQDYGSYGGGKIRRAKKIVVKNLSNHRGTEVEFSDIVVNGSANASDFSVSSLKRGE